MSVFIPKNSLPSSIYGKKNKKNKYNNKRITVNGIKYDSTGEYERHKYLIKLQKMGLISNLRFHDSNDIIILKDNPKIIYIPDFCYVEKDKSIVEDFKGVQTKEFSIKKRLLQDLIITQKIDIVFRIVKKTKGKFIAYEEYEI